MSPKKYTSWTTLLMKQLNLPPLPTLTLYHRHTQPGSCLLTDVSEAAEHDDDLCCAGRGCRGGRGVKDWRSWAISVVHRFWKCYCTATDSMCTLNNLAFSFLRGTISPPPTLVALTYNHSVKRILWAIEWCARWLSRWSGWRDGVTWVYSGEFFWKSWILVQLHMSPQEVH